MATERLNLAVFLELEGDLEFLCLVKRLMDTEITRRAARLALARELIRCATTTTKD